MNRHFGAPDELLSGVVAIGGHRLDLGRHEVLAPDGTKLDLSPRAIRVLRLLAVDAGRVVGKDRLLSEGWPDVIVTEDSLTQVVSEIRKALGPAGRDAIRTVPRQGYMLIPDREPLPDSAASTAPEPQPAPTAPPRASLLRPTAIASAILVLVLATVTLLLRPWQAPPGSLPAVVAVLPLKNVSGDAALQYFADGTTDNLAMIVSRSPYVRVRTGVPAELAPLSAEDAGRRLGAEYALSGSVQRDSDRMRVIAELVNVETGAHVWAEAIDLQSDDPFALQDEIARRVVRSVIGERGVLVSNQREVVWGRDPTDFDEYDYYLRGHRLFHEETEEATLAALQIWQDGLRRFPNSALLKIKVAWAYDQLFYLGVSKDPQGDVKRAWDLAQDAFRSPEMSPLAEALGRFLLCNLWIDYRYDIKGSEGDCRKAIELQPYDPTVQHGLAWWAIQAGDLPLARRMLADVATDLPNPVFGFAYKAWLNFAEKDYDGCVRAADTAPAPTVFYSQPFRAACLVALGRQEEAKAEVARMMAANPQVSLEFFRSYHVTADPEIVGRELDLLGKAGLRQRPEAAS